MVAVIVDAVVVVIEGWSELSRYLGQNGFGRLREYEVVRIVHYWHTDWMLEWRGSSLGG